MSAELVERAQRGDHEAFEVLAAAAYHRLFAIARRILRDRYAAEDAVQDCLVRAWRDLWALRDPERFDAWLHRLLVRACSDVVRRSKRTRLDVAVSPLEHEAPGDAYAQFIDRDQLERAFLRLSLEQRAVVVLTHYLGLSGPEVAEVLGVPPGTVASRLHYGLRVLRTALTDGAPSPASSAERIR